MKKCSKCSEEKELTEFHKSKATKDGLVWCCKPCALERARAWNLANSERKRVTREAWTAANRDKLAASRLIWYAANRERIHKRCVERYAANRDRNRKLTAAWKREHPELVFLQCHRRRARKHNAFVEDVLLSIVLERDKGICGICQEPILDKPSLDHVIPLSKGGEHSYANIQLAHLLCNIRKGAKLPEEMAA